MARQIFGVVSLMAMTVKTVRRLFMKGLGGRGFFAAAFTDVGAWIGNLFCGFNAANEGAAASDCEWNRI